MEIRTAHCSEFAEVAEVYQAVWHETHAPHIAPEVAHHRGRQFFLDRVTAYNPPPIVALHDGHIVGFSVWMPEYFSQLWVLPEARSLGVGALLLAEAERRIAEAGADKAGLICRVGNDVGRRFFERNGWQVVGTHDTHLGTADEPVAVPVWVMEKRFDRKS